MDGLVYFARRKKIDLECNSWRGGQKRARKRSQTGLLNYPEVQRSVTSRQPLRDLPTEVFLCGGSNGGICRVAASLARLLDERPARGNKNIRTSQAAN